LESEVKTEFNNDDETVTAPLVAVLRDRSNYEMRTIVRNQIPEQKPQPVAKTKGLSDAVLRASESGAIGKTEEGAVVKITLPSTVPQPTETKVEETSKSKKSIVASRLAAMRKK